MTMYRASSARRVGEVRTNGKNGPTEISLRRPTDKAAFVPSLPARRTVRQNMICALPRAQRGLTEETSAHVCQHGRGATGGLTAKVEGRNVARAGQAPGTRGEQMPDLALARSSSRRNGKGRSAVAPAGSSIRLTTRPGRRPRRSGLLVRASDSPTSLEFTQQEDVDTHDSTSGAVVPTVGAVSVFPDSSCRCSLGCSASEERRDRSAMDDEGAALA